MIMLTRWGPLACAFALASAVQEGASAQNYEAGPFKVAGYRTGADGTLFTLSPAPAGCSGASNYGEHIIIPADAPNRQEIVATLITAYFTQEKVGAIWYGGSGPCSETRALPVFMVRMAMK